MDDKQPSALESRRIDGSSVWVLLRVSGLFLLGVAFYATISFPNLMETSDYLSAFYVSGKAVLLGRASALYPTAKDIDFHSLSFNQLAHQVLPHLAPAKTAIYMYSPDNALLFASLAWLPPMWSMLVWQVLSVISMLLTVYLVCRLPDLSGQLFRRKEENTESKQTARPGPARIRSGSLDGIFFSLCLFLPVIHTLLIGQLGLILGVLPCVAALSFLLRKKELQAGLVLAVFLLKPHFMPIALLLAGALALNKRYHCAAGLFLGCASLAGISALMLGAFVWPDFIYSFRMTDTFFSNPSYGVPLHLVACLPGVVMQWLPSDQRQLAKLITNTIALLCGMQLLNLCRMLFVHETYERAVVTTIMLGILVLPIVVPHLLFYDLCIFAVAGLLVFQMPWEREEKFVLTAWAVSAWVFLDFYYVVAVSGQNLISPVVLVGILLSILILTYCRLLKFAVSKWL